MPKEALKTARFFSLKGDEPFASWLLQCTYPWESLADLGAWIKAYGATLPSESYTEIAPDIWVAKSANVSDLATLKGPVIVGPDVEIRPGAFIRGNAYIGPNCVVGTASEIKNSLLFGDVEVPHYNYIGDSILSYGTHFGAGAITSNLRSDKKNIKIRYEGEVIETGLRKIGAITAQRVEIGCNAVLGPGTLIGKDSLIYPLTFVRFSMPEKSMLKNNGELRPRI